MIRRWHRPLGSLLSTVALAWLVAACNVNPYSLGGGSAAFDAGPIDATPPADGGNHDDASPAIDAGPDASTCLPAPERCNHVDDDCDNLIDEGFNTAADPNNCGDCGVKCTYPNAFGLCQNSACTRGTCQPGWHDLDANANDCEYFCIESNGGVEVCDNRDNNCDGVRDEGFNTQTDTANCGSCGNQCNLLNATPTCTAGTCQVVSCNPGFVDIDHSPVNGCEYQCTPTNGGVESCDGVDNDCDGTVDDGNPGGNTSCGTSTGACTAGTTVCSFGVLFCVGAINGGPETCNNLDDDCDGSADEDWNKQTDVLHCGGCSPCSLPHATPTCGAGTCHVGTCAFGYFDIDGSPGDGCEYACIPTGVELCDQTDNNCNGVADEGFNLQTDRNNCGVCGNVCSFTNAAATCTSSACAMGACAANFYDLDNNPANGCEYGCVKTNGGVEKCDGLDNDCNGVVDNGNPGANVACGSNVGQCRTGLTSCTAGQIVCNNPPPTGPVPETCDSLDNNCNGTADEGYDKLNDPRYCGGCTACALNHAIAGCAAGHCTVAACLGGYVNGDGDPANGCEYACTPSGTEVCDGIDNDCDGKIDGADPDLVRPANFCKTLGECAGTAPSCTGMTGWDCVYTDPDVQLDASQNVVLEESRCDNKDNDCDGGVDEVYSLKGSACGEDGTFATTRKLGACRGTGALVCNGAGNGLACNVTSAGATAVKEDCNNRDDDCDGHVDEPYDSSLTLQGVRDSLVGPLTINGSSVVMYKYEASRPDADAAGTTPGFVETRACSTPSRLPWAGGNLAEVRTACQSAGMRLCRVTRNGTGQVVTDEWGRFCEGAGNTTYPYGNTYAANACNGSDYDPVPGGVNEDLAIRTGSLATCTSADAALDLSGNLKEWVDDARTAGAQTVYTLRGGSFDNYRTGLGCDFDLTVVPSSYVFDDAGFRCCSLACAAGQSECSGTCRNLASDVNNCGACGRACGAGQGCFDGYCCPTGTVLCPGTDQCKPANQC